MIGLNATLTKRGSSGIAGTTVSPDGISGRSPQTATHVGFCGEAAITDGPSGIVANFAHRETSANRVAASSAAGKTSSHESGGQGTSSSSSWHGKSRRSVGT